MQDRSENWKALAKTGTALLNSVAVVGGKEYSSTTAPVITRGLFSEAPSVGNCTSANLRLSILTDDDIPKSAEVQIKMRLLEELGGLSSEWLPAGTFYITNRSKDYSSGLLTLECYDAMLKAQQDFFQEGEEIDQDLWPRPMSEIVTWIAARMGVELDNRTVIKSGDAYEVTCPESLSMLDVLGYIGAAHGGNWSITPEGKLRLVPLVSPPDDSTEDALDVVAVLSKLTTGQPLTITSVTISGGTDGSTYTAGDSSGYTLTITGNPYASQVICDDLYATYGGLIYNPFTAEKAIYDPAAELGDQVRYNGLVYSFLVKETITLNTMFQSSMEAPTNAEYEDEYPYLSSREKDTEAIKDEINDLITVVADKASITDLYAIYAVINNLSVDDIKTGIIRSSDYSVTQTPYLFPLPDLFPAEDVYPSNGERVLTGFAIDFASGMIYGAFYSAQIAALESALEAIEVRLESIEDEDYGKEIDALRQTVSDLSASLTELGTAVSELTEREEEQDKKIEDLKTDVADLKAEQTDTKKTVGSIQSEVTGTKQDLFDLVDTVSGHASTISSIQQDLVDASNTIVEIQRSMDTLESGTLAEMQETIKTMQEAIEKLQNSLTYPKG